MKVMMEATLITIGALFEVFFMAPLQRTLFCITFSVLVIQKFLSDLNMHIRFPDTELQTHVNRICAYKVGKMSEMSWLLDWLLDEHKIVN